MLSKFYLTTSTYPILIPSSAVPDMTCPIHQLCSYTSWHPTQQQAHILPHFLIHCAWYDMSCLLTTLPYFPTPSTHPPIISSSAVPNMMCPIHWPHAHTSSMPHLMTSMYPLLNSLSFSVWFLWNVYFYNTVQCISLKVQNDHEPNATNSVLKSSWQLVQRLATGLDCSCQLWSIVISPVANCLVCQTSKKPNVDQLQPVFLRTSCLAHDSPHIPYFSHISCHLFESTRVLSIMVTAKLIYNAKLIISWAFMDKSFDFWVSKRPGASSIFHIYIFKWDFHMQLTEDWSFKRLVATNVTII